MEAWNFIGEARRKLSGIGSSLSYHIERSELALLFPPQHLSPTKMPTGDDPHTHTHTLDHCLNLICTRLPLCHPGLSFLHSSPNVTRGLCASQCSPCSHYIATAIWICQCHQSGKSRTNFDASITAQCDTHAYLLALHK